MIFLVAAYFAPGSVWANPAVRPDDRVQILVRYDDYTRDSSISLEESLLGGVRELGVPMLVGVVPFLGEPYPWQSVSVPNKQLTLGQDKIARLRAVLPGGNVEIALHGFNHRANYVINGQNSEFAGLSLERQRLLLSLGRSSLEQAFGVPVRVFTPPFNAFDVSTLAAMEGTGFAVLSAGVAGPAKEVRLRYIPGTTYPQKFRRVVEEALRNYVPNTLVVVVMHPYDFVESDDAMPRFRKDSPKISVRQVLDDIRWAKSQPGVKFVSVAGAQAERDDLSATRVASNLQLRGSWVRSHALLPASWGSGSLEGNLLPTSAARGAFWKENLLALSLFAAIGATAYALSRWLNKSARIARWRRAQRRLLAATLPIVLLASMLGGFYFSKAALLALGLGWYGGTHPRS